MGNYKQLNPFEIKSLISSMIANSYTEDTIENSVEDIKNLDAQNDKKTIIKLLYKELYNLKTDSNTLLCLLLERFADKEELTKKLWEILRNELAPNNLKIFAINFLRGLDSNWELDSGDELLDEQIIDNETRKLLNNALVNPEIQIDFLDFLTSLSSNDKITLIDSLAQDYEQDELANVLIPIFLSQPDSPQGLRALEILGESKSQLAFHALNSSINFINESILPKLKKSLSTLKIAGIREDNSSEFYKGVLSETEPYKCCVTYPDGHGNQALIFTRKTKENRIRFIAIVTDDYNGIRDCFGFYDISQFECDKIIERFYSQDKEINVSPNVLHSLLTYFENISKQKGNWLIPYEYVCWKNLLHDIETQDIDKYLKEHLQIKKLSKTDLENIYQIDFMNKWFLDAKYSDEFENYINNFSLNSINEVNKQVDIVFDNKEKEIWQNRLMISSYLKLAENKKEEAILLYSLYNSDTLINELFTNILKRSIYEYYINLKYSTELNNGKYSLSELDGIIKQIEDAWVCTK